MKRVEVRAKRKGLTMTDKAIERLAFAFVAVWVAAIVVTSLSGFVMEAVIFFIPLLAIVVLLRVIAALITIFFQAIFGKRW